MKYIDNRVVYLAYKGISNEYLNAVLQAQKEMGIETDIIYMDLSNISIISILMWYYMLYKDMIKKEVRVGIIFDSGRIDWYKIGTSGDISQLVV